MVTKFTHPKNKKKNNCRNSADCPLVNEDFYVILFNFYDFFYDRSFTNYFFYRNLDNALHKSHIKLREDRSNVSEDQSSLCPVFSSRLSCSCNGATAAAACSCSCCSCGFVFRLIDLASRNEDTHL
jgi:hypothetical protein